MIPKLKFSSLYLNVHITFHPLSHMQCRENKTKQKHPPGHSTARGLPCTNPRRTPLRPSSRKMMLHSVRCLVAAGRTRGHERQTGGMLAGGGTASTETPLSPLAHS